MREITLRRAPVNQLLPPKEIRFSQWPRYPEWAHWQDIGIQSYDDHYYVTRYDDLNVALNIEDLGAVMVIAIRAYTSEGRRTSIGANVEHEPGILTADLRTFERDDAIAQRDWIMNNLPSALILKGL